MTTIDKAEQGQTYLRKKDVARILGITVRTVEKWIASGELKHIKKGRLVFIARDDFEKFMDDGRE